MSRFVVLPQAIEMQDVIWRRLGAEPSACAQNDAASPGTTAQGTGPRRELRPCHEIAEDPAAIVSLPLKSRDPRSFLRPALLPRRAASAGPPTTRATCAAPPPPHPARGPARAGMAIDPAAPESPGRWNRRSPPAPDCSARR